MKLIFLNTYIIAVKETSKPSEPSAHYLCLLPLTLSTGFKKQDCGFESKTQSHIWDSESHIWDSQVYSAGIQERALRDQRNKSYLWKRIVTMNSNDIFDTPKPTFL